MILPKDLLESVDRHYAESFTSRGDEDPRLGDVIVTHPDGIRETQKGDIVVIGFPQDEGVRRNFGRAGAAGGPNTIRTRLAKFTLSPDWNDISSGKRRITDIGNIRCDDNLEQTQKMLGEVVAAVLQSEATPIIFGGGHETAYGHYLAYEKSQRRMGVVNVDAHLDVRPLRDGQAHSGSPFRQMIESNTSTLIPGGYLCVGIQPQANSPQVLRFMKEHNCRWISVDDARTSKRNESVDTFIQSVKRSGGSLMLTVDLDGIRQSDAPGVSAPSPIGLAAGHVQYLVRHYGAPHATSFDISECNPVYDRDNQTAHLASLLAYTFIAGVLAREIE